MRKLLFVLISVFLVVNIFSSVNYAACNRKSTFVEEMRIFTPVIYIPGSKDEYLPGEYLLDTPDITSEEYGGTEKSKKYSDEEGVAESRTTSSEEKTVRINNVVVVSGSDIFNSASKTDRQQAENVFVLPVQGKNEINYEDISKSLPQVDWDNLDRLYIPAGNYSFIKLGNLPVRSPQRPLIITNYGGQVRIGSIIKTDNNSAENVDGIKFHDIYIHNSNDYYTYGNNHYNRIRIWDNYTGIYGMDIYYKIGDYVYFKDELYVCVMEGRHTGVEPSNSPNVWKPAVPPWMTSGWIGNCR